MRQVVPLKYIVIASAEKKKLKLRESCYVPPTLKVTGGSGRKKKSNLKIKNRSARVSFCKLSLL